MEEATRMDFEKFFEQIPANFVRPFLSYVTLIDQNFEFA